MDTDTKPAPNLTTMLAVRPPAPLDEDELEPREGS
jgi:hypothetical protein